MVITRFFRLKLQYVIVSFLMLLSLTFPVWTSMLVLMYHVSELWVARVSWKSQRYSRNIVG